MQIKLLKLIGYTRLMANNTHYFEWTPSKQMMVILGSNGSGKSSIISELTPVVSSSSNFKQGGEKHFHCHANGKDYKLISKYNRGTGHHSFLCNDEELNSGHTFKEQEELVMAHFGLNRELHEMLTGKMRFTKLKPNERKAWLTRMSVVNLDYAFNVYNKVRKELSNQQGTVKTINKRLVTEHHGVLNDSEMTQLKEVKQRLVSRIDLLYKTRDKKGVLHFRDETTARKELDSILDEARSLLMSFPMLPIQVKVDGYESFLELNNKKIEEYKSIQAVIARLVEELEELKSSNPNTAERMPPEEIQELKDRHEHHTRIAEEAISKYKKYTGRFPLVDISVNGDPSGKLTDLSDRWIKLLTTFPNNENGYLSKETAIKNAERLKELKSKYSTMEGMYLQINQRLNSFKECASITCPSCTHSFKPGVSEQDITIAEERKAKLDEAMDSCSNEIKVLEQYMTDFNEYVSYVHGYVQLTKEYNEFDTLWNYVAEHVVMYRTPAKYINDALDWRDAMQQLIVSKQAHAEATLLAQRLRVIAEMDQDALGFIKARTTALETEINNKTHVAADLQRKASHFNKAGNAIREWEDKYHSFIERWEQFIKKIVDTADNFVDKAYQAEIDAVNLELSSVHSRLSEMERHEERIKVLESEVNHAQQMATDLAILEKALSPKSGILGRYLLGFLQGVVKLVNAYINEIWTYRLEVLPSNVDKDGMDYKFPMHIAGGDVQPPDIEYGSDSQLEIVDFAFRMAILKFLHLDDMPLFLDEFSRTFDEQHRANAIPFINRLIENGIVNQVFFISHFESTHGAFNQAEFIVLDPANISTPEVFNKNLVLK
ncbi:putative SbcC protein [Pseudomonas phage vB_PaeM_kmuB]|nr:putative SbcC protein [Pseudomonas phage vB_PaeM_kmuB]